MKYCMPSSERRKTMVVGVIFPVVPSEMVSLNTATAVGVQTRSEMAIQKPRGESHHKIMRLRI